jgi:hypothetical protein
MCALILTWPVLSRMQSVMLLLLLLALSSGMFAKTLESKLCLIFQTAFSSQFVTGHSIHIVGPVSHALNKDSVEYSLSWPTGVLIYDQVIRPMLLEPTKTAHYLLCG